MKSDLPKVAHRVVGRSLVEWVIGSVAPAKPDSLAVVLGHGADEVRPLLGSQPVVGIQEHQLGTGHATKVGLGVLGELDDNDTVVVLYGDMPLLTTELIKSLVARPEDIGVVMVTADLDDPSGYGRIIRVDGDVVGVVEDRDCDAEQLLIAEINAGVYAFQAGALVDALEAIGSDNAQGEQYLTDVIGILASKGVKLKAVKAEAEEVIGINSHDQLAEAGQILRRRINSRHMEAGVQIVDPDHTYIDPEVEIAPGATIYPGVHLEGSTKVGANAQVGPDVLARDSQIGSDALVWYSVLRSAVVGSHCEVGPYASLRAGTVLADRAKVGTFVETKNAKLGEGAKAPHLTYLGDATVGSGTNIGAGTITCNFDGYEKHATVIGDDVFIGSDTMLVAPLTIGDRAITGAGSAITKDVEADALAVERSDQKVIPGYARRRAERQANKKAEE